MMADSTLNKALDGLTQALDNVRQVADNLPDAAGAMAHGASGGMIDPFVFRLAIFVLAIVVGYYVRPRCTRL
jgi:H+-translocating NAD(P) transhydrogenase subunit alpha